MIDDIPVEGSPAGDAMALMLMGAPLAAVLVSFLVKKTGLAFVAAVAASGTVIGLTLRYCFKVAPVDSTVTGAWIFGGGASALSLFMTTLIVGARALSRPPPRATAHPVDTPPPPLDDASPFQKPLRPCNPPIERPFPAECQKPPALAPRLQHASHRI